MAQGGGVAAIKHKSFSAPSTCPIDLFGPLANRTILKRLHVRFHRASMSIRYDYVLSGQHIHETVAFAYALEFRALAQLPVTD